MRLSLGSCSCGLRRVSLLLVVSCIPCRAGIGFCLDEVPVELEDTGFTAPSSYSTQVACEAAGHEWCPLQDQTDTWQGVEYYWYSACCTGRQGASLLVDDAGFPTCGSDIAAHKCKRLHWHEKALNDVVLTDDYVMDAAPVEVEMPPMQAPGLREAPTWPPCICSPDSEDCIRTSRDGTRCINCKTRVPCANDTVWLGLHVFKLHSIDLKSTTMSLAAWVREEWFDSRLSYNIQCYGGLDYFEVKAQDGALEDSRIWVPDIELYNNEEPIWSGSLPGRLAMVYPCTGTGRPASKCGYVFWSRPGLVKALCKFDGLEMFPLDTLRCKLELAAFNIDGRYQDVIPRTVDGGVSFVGKEEADGFEGITAGTQFQDYRILDVTADRYITIYDCCHANPYPTIIYEVTLGRASTFYIVRLMLPAISLAAISFITFWMNPDIGERLGFGITVILAMVANDVVASDMMPIAGERLLMDHISLGCQIFGWISLVETAVVLYLFHHLADDWVNALVPSFFLKGRELLKDRWQGAKKARMNKTYRGGFMGAFEESMTLGSRTSFIDPRLQEDVDQQVKKLAEELYESKDRMMRKHLYRQIFYMVDKDFSGTLSLNEIEEFGAFMMGSNWSKDKAKLFMRSLDVNRDGVLKLDEFAIFCEGHLQEDTHDNKYITKMVEGFLQVLERKHDTKVRMWQQRAKNVDQFCRWTLPPGFILFLTVVLNLSEEQMNNLMWDRSGQFWLFSISFWPLFITSLAVLLYMVVFSGVHRTLSESVARVRTNSGLPDDVEPMWQPMTSPAKDERAGVSRDPCELNEVKIPGSVNGLELRDTAAGDQARPLHIVEPRKSQTRADDHDDWDPEFDADLVVDSESESSDSS